MIQVGDEHDTLNSEFQHETCVFVIMTAKLKRIPSKTRLNPAIQNSAFRQSIVSLFVGDMLVDSTLVVLLAVQDSENGQEQVDDIQVERDGSCNLLLNMVVSHDELCVDQNVTTEDECTNNAVSQLNGAGVREEGCHEAEDDDNPKSSSKIRDPAGKVVLGLAGEKSECDKNTEREDERLKYNLALEKGCDNTDRVRFHRGEASKEEQIGRV